MDNKQIHEKRHSKRDDTMSSLCSIPPHRLAAVDPFPSSPLGGVLGRWGGVSGVWREKSRQRQKEETKAGERREKKV